jgi:hypothetical protein
MGIGAPSKLGVARRSRIAWLRDFSTFDVLAIFAASCLAAAAKLKRRGQPGDHYQLQTIPKIAPRDTSA